jgi:hypothetical protein
MTGRFDICFSKLNIIFSLFFKDKNMKVFSKHIKLLAELLLYKNYKRMSQKFLILFTILTVLLSIEGKTQQNFRFGILCGSSFSRFISQKQYRVFDKWKIGIYPKVVCRLPLKKGFWLQTEVGITDYGFKTEYNNDSIHQVLKESRYFIQFTELLGYSLKIDTKKGIKLNIESGPFFGYYLISNQNSWTENLLDHSIWEYKEFRNVCDDPMINKYIVGISAGTGISKEIRGATILLDIRYDLSITRITKYPDFPELPNYTKMHYQLFSISFGYLFGQNKW